MDFTKLGAQIADLQAAHVDRLIEANELLATARYGTAIVLGLYPLEIYLKVRVCQRLDLARLRVVFQIHDLDGLLILAGFRRRMDGLGVHPVKANWDFLASMSVQHINELRYTPNANRTQSEAERVLMSLQHPNDGVLSWLASQP